MGVARQETCAICGKPVPKPFRVYCSAACAAEGERRAQYSANNSHVRSGIYRWLTCPDCGVTVWRHIKCKRCADCQAEANRIASKEYHAAKSRGHTRIIGDQYPCERCGQLYVLASGRQRYCPDCAAEAVTANVRAYKRAWNHDRYFSTPEGRAYKKSLRSGSRHPEQPKEEK